MVQSIRNATVNRVEITGGGGVSTLNGETGDITLTSSGGSITITQPTSDTINLESVSGGSGTVTTVSVATANGFAGTVTNATSTPAITMKTTVTGILKGDGTAISAATGGTDYTNLAFKTISVSGQSDVVADGPEDTLTFAAGSNITITTNAGTDTVTIAASSGSGDVVGPSSATDNAIARFDGTTGKLIQNSAVTVADTSGNITGGTYNGNTIGSGSTSGTNTGDQTSVSGNAGTATALQTGRTIAITGDLAYTSPSFDGTANVTAAGTLATVNSNVGTFGSATKTVTATANAKGLITAISEQTVTPAVGSITGLGTGVGTFLATPSSANLAAAVTDETGTGALVFGTAPTLSNPVVGTQSAADNSTKGASTAYVTSAISTAIAGVNPAVAVQFATTLASDTSAYTYNNGAAGVGATLTGANNVAFTADGQTATALLQRILIKNDTQSPSGAFNGVYYVTQLQTAILPPILTRALDYDQSSDINNTGAIPVVNGALNASTSWLLTSQVTTVGTDPLTYVKFSINPTTILTNALTNTHIFVGNSSNIATDVAASGDLTLANTGAFTVAKIQGTVVSGTTGSGNIVFSTSPTLVTPALGTPASGVATNLTGTASGLTAGTVTTNANLTGPVNSSGNATTLISGLYATAPSTVSLGNATLTYVMPFSGTVNTLYAQTTSGSLTWAWKINGTNITGLSAVSVTSTPSITSATAANTFSAGDTITAVSTGASSDLGPAGTLKFTRT